MFGCFCKQLNVISKKAEFEAVDGYHFATIDEENIVSLQMKDVDTVKTNQIIPF
jgi:diaminopimelate epimerase